MQSRAHLGHNMVFSTWLCSSINKRRNSTQTVPSLLSLTHIIFMTINVIKLREATLVDKLARTRVIQTKNSRQNQPSPEELSINQNPIRMLCRLLGYNLLGSATPQAGIQLNAMSSVSQVPQKGRGSPFQRLLPIDLDLTPFSSCPPKEDPPTMVFCVTMQFKPLLGEGLLLMGRLDTPVDPVECTFEGPSSYSTCIYGPGRGCPSSYYGPSRTSSPFGPCLL